LADEFVGSIPDQINYCLSQQRPRFERISDENNSGGSTTVGEYQFAKIAVFRDEDSGIVERGFY
jgi:hypothetical protein